MAALWDSMIIGKYKQASKEDLMKRMGWTDSMAAYFIDDFVPMTIRVPARLKKKLRHPFNYFERMVEATRYGKKLTRAMKDCAPLLIWLMPEFSLMYYLNELEAVPYLAQFILEGCHQEYLRSIKYRLTHSEFTSLLECISKLPQQFWSKVMNVALKSRNLKVAEYRQSWEDEREKAAIKALKEDKL